MADVYLSLGILDRARELFQQAQVLQDEYGATPADRAHVQLRLGTTALNEQDYATADKHYQQCLDILSEANLEESLATADALERRAKIRDLDGEFDAAKDLLERAFAIRRRVSDDPADGIRHHYNLGRSALYRGDPELGVEEIEKAIALYESSGKPNYPVSSLFHKLGEAHIESGDMAEAKEAIDKAMSLTRDSFGQDHPGIGVALSSLGQVATANGAFEEAKKYHAESHRLACKFHGPESAAAATQICMLGTLHIDLGDLIEAKKLLEEGLVIRRKTFGNRGAPVGRCLLFLGEVEGMQRKHEPAIKRFREAYAVLSEALGDPHPDTQVAIGYLVMHLKATKSGEVAEWRARLK